jgi:hypothetical protein
LTELLSLLEAFESVPLASLTDDSAFRGPDELAGDNVVTPASATAEGEPEFIWGFLIESLAAVASMDADGKLLAPVFTTEPAFPSALTLLLRGK